MRAILPLLALGCATGAVHTVSFKPVSNAAHPPIAYSVGDGTVTGSDLDLREASDCIRGSWGRLPIDFCREGDRKGGQERWSGASGQFVVAADEKNLNVSGVFILDTGRSVSMNQYVPFGAGAPWDELRRHPGLLALAATVADLQAARIGH